MSVQYWLLVSAIRRGLVVLMIGFPSTSSIRGKNSVVSSKGLDKKVTILGFLMFCFLNIIKEILAH